MKKNLKILITGYGTNVFYEDALCNAFDKAGNNVQVFRWNSFFTSNNPVIRLIKRIEDRFLFGPTILFLNISLLNYCKINKPDFVFVYRGTHILPICVKLLKKNGVIVMGYNNDNPFGNSLPPFMWRHFISSCKVYDILFIYRDINRDKYEQLGAKNITLLRPYFINDRNYSILNQKQNKYTSDVTFIGHYEDDGRDELLKSIFDKGVNLKVYGSFWSKSKHYNYFKERLGDIPIVVKDYNIVLNSTKIALSFLSKLNNDVYTRRCFEIPATKTFMLCEYTKEMNDLFKEGVDAEYFRSEEELLNKIKYYLNNPKRREEIANSGYERVIKDRHEVSDRANEIIYAFNKIKDVK